MAGKLLWAQVVSRRRETASIVSLEIEAAIPGGLPEFSAGSHIDVHLPGNLVRQYSLLRTESNPGRYTIAVLLCEPSRGGSRCIHETFAAGHRFQISLPRNDFELAGTGRRALLFAGGIGITPILAMAETLHRTGVDFELHYSARSRAATAFLERIALAGLGGRTHLHFDDEPASGMRLEAHLRSWNDPDTHLYVCGPHGYMTAILDTARNQGWTAQRLHRESFTPADPASGTDRDFDIQLARTGTVLRVPAGYTITAVLAEHGINIPISCEQGLCGTCLTRVIAGIPDHRDFFLTDDEHAANDQITPCCSRAKSERLVLDL